jgi:Domain of Unknown Function (DUF748)
MRHVWIVATVTGLVLVLVGVGVERHFTSTAYIEKSLNTTLASGKGVNRIKIGSSTFSLLGGTFSARDVEFVPDTTLIAQRVRNGKPVRSRSSIIISSLRVKGIRAWPLLHRKIIIDSITLDGSKFDISTIREPGPKPAPNPSPKAATLPQISFQSLAMPVHINMIRLTNSIMTYSETARTGARPGTIRFSDMDAKISNVTNDSTLMTAGTPCTIHVSTLLNEAGRLDATFGYNLLSPKLSMTCRGTVSRMNAKPLNELLENLNGIKITSGVVDSTRFDFKIDGDDVARGTVEVLYHELNIQMEDKVTLEQDLMARFKSFVNDKVKMHDSNPLDEDKLATVATIARERTPQTPLIKFLWESLREGILTTLGV